MGGGGRGGVSVSNECIWVNVKLERQREIAGAGEMIVISSVCLCWPPVSKAALGSIFAESVGHRRPQH